MNKDERIGFRVSAEIKKLLFQIAEKEGRSLAQICEVFLRGGIDAYQKEGTKYIQRMLPTGFYQLRFRILRPEPWANQVFSARLDCTAKALSKLLWFLEAFAYDGDLLSRGEIDDRALVGLQGIVKISYAHRNGRSCWNLDAFDHVSRWSDPISVTDASGQQS